jgi:hypothetical protein
MKIILEIITSNKSEEILMNALDMQTAKHFDLFVLNLMADLGLEDDAIQDSYIHIKSEVR